MMNMMTRLEHGRAHEREIDMLLELTKQVCWFISLINL
jgi:NADH:ubiquinone oxidoreductase subunit F (NADH-binding)